MKPFTYVVPKSLAEAKAAAKDKDTIVKGAGLDIVDRMKERLQTPQRVVNLLPLKDEMSGVEKGDDDEHLRLQHWRQFRLPCGTFQESAAQQTHADTDAESAEADQKCDGNCR